MSNKALPVYVVNSTGGGGTGDAYSKLESDERFVQQTTFYNYAGGSSMSPPNSAASTYLSNASAASTYATKVEVKTLKDDVAAAIAPMMDDITDLYALKENVANKVNSLSTASTVNYPTVTAVKNYITTDAVSSLNTITGQVSIAAGSNVTISNNTETKTITINSTSSGGGGTPVVPSQDGISVLNDTQAPSCSNVANHVLLLTGGTLTGRLTVPQLEMGGMTVNAISTNLGSATTTIPTEAAVKNALTTKLDVTAASATYQATSAREVGTTLTNDSAKYPSSATVTKVLESYQKVANLSNAIEDSTTTYPNSHLLYTVNGNIAGKLDASTAEATYEKISSKETGSTISGSTETYPSSATVNNVLANYQISADREVGTTLSGLTTKYPSSSTVSAVMALTEKTANKEVGDTIANNTALYPSSRSVYQTLQSYQPVSARQSTLTASTTQYPSSTAVVNYCSGFQTVAKMETGTTLANDNTKYPSSATVTSALSTLGSSFATTARDPQTFTGLNTFAGLRLGTAPFTAYPTEVYGITPNIVTEPAPASTLPTASSVVNLINNRQANIPNQTPTLNVPYDMVSTDNNVASVMKFRLAWTAPGSQHLFRIPLSLPVQGAAMLTLTFATNDSFSGIPIQCYTETWGIRKSAATAPTHVLVQRLCEPTSISEKYIDFTYEGNAWLKVSISCARTPTGVVYGTMLASVCLWRFLS